MAVCKTCGGTGIELSGVCHCGESMDDPSVFAHDNHSAVEMERECETCGGKGEVDGTEAVPEKQ